MRIRTLAGTFILGAACALVTTNAISQHDHSGHDHDHAQDHSHDHDQAMPTQEEMMQKWMEMAAPNENHAKLDYFVGDWNITSKMWMEGHGNPPMEEAGTASFKWILDKRFLEQNYDATMMGIPYKGRGVSGYDNMKKKWVGTWINNTGTNISYMEGTIDQTGKVWTYFGTMDEWMTGEHDRIVKYVLRINNDNNFTFEVHDLAIVPGETKVVEIDYTRKN